MAVYTNHNEAFMKKDSFTVAGTACSPEGETKVCFGTDLVVRTKAYIKAKWTNIELFELPREMTRLEALRHLDEMKLSGDAGYVVAYKLAEKTREAKKQQLKVRSLDELRQEALKVKERAS